MRALVGLLALAVIVSGCVAQDDTADPDLDTDGDGFTDVVELENGTDPKDAASFPQTNMTHTPEWGGLDAAIRPGAPIGWCTYNFLFFAPENGTYYIGTAAHCTDGPGQRMPLAGFMDEIGTVVYDSDNATGGNANADFSLIQLDDGLNLEANPTMMNLEGPKGYTLSEEVAIGDVIEHHGYGMVFGSVDATRDRHGYFSGWADEPGKDYCSESPIWWGDSGSPIMHQDTQKAFGIVSRAGWIDCLPTAQLMGATVEYILAELGEYGWEGVELAIVE